MWSRSSSKNSSKSSPGKKLINDAPNTDAETDAILSKIMAARANKATAGHKAVDRRSDTSSEQIHSVVQQQQPRQSPVLKGASPVSTPSSPVGQPQPSSAPEMEEDAEDVEGPATPKKSPEVSAKFENVGPTTKSLPPVVEECDESIEEVRAEKPAIVASKRSSSINTSEATDVSLQYVHRDRLAELHDQPPVGEHLFQMGFCNGSYSDITIGILGRKYSLHKIILSRFSFFKALFATITSANAAEEVTIHVDYPHVSHEAVEIVLASMYGLVCPFVSSNSSVDLSINPDNVLSVLVTATFFEHKRLRDQCLAYIVRVDLAPHHRRKPALTAEFPQFEQESVEIPTPVHRVIRYLKFIDCMPADILESSPVASFVLERIEDALLNYLCFEGYASLEDIFVEMPIEWVERVLEADAFWCPSEFGRYQFAKRVIMKRRLRDVQRQGSQERVGDRTIEEVYTDIFRYAIIYTHMTFEQLNEVRGDKFVSEDILMKSLWYQTRLRATIEASATGEISTAETEQIKQDKQSEDTAESTSSPSSQLMAPIRIGIEFKTVDNIQEGERVYSAVFFYGGSWWAVFLQWFPEQVSEESGAVKPAKWGVFLRRSEGSEIMKIATKSSNSTMQGFEDATTPAPYEPELIRDPLTGTEVETSISYYHDKRQAVNAVFKLFNPSIKSYEPIFESKANEYVETQSWGFRSKDNVVTAYDTHETIVRLAVVMKYVN